MTIESMPQPPVDIPTRSFVCSVCNGDMKVLGVGRDDLCVAERVLVDCDACKNGMVIEEVPFLVFDTKNRCWLGFSDNAEEVIQDPLRDSMNHFEDWEEAREYVLIYLEKFGVNKSDLKFIDVQDKSEV